ncbi:MAG: SBBP repeat-containing protein [Chlorobi bacterium]|nr:SBBP repeat-containing protein [Chlorobiota bacterium]MCI0716821.1 SBBP repeat-containing protein [Chlorobiota bacterium]
MISKIYLFLLIISGFAPFSQAQVSEQWIARYHPSLSQNDYGNDMLLDELGNIYVIGITKNQISGDNNWIILKYSSSGNMLWEITYNGLYSNGSDEAISIALSNTENCIYVTGFVRPLNAGPRSIITKKITFSGEQIWSKTYTSNDDIPFKIAVSESGNIFVAGRTNTSGLLIKYNQNGDLQWIKDYNFNNLLNNGFVDMCIDPEENIYAVSSSGTNPIVSDFTATKFNSSGNLIWEKIYNGPANDNDEPCSIGIDNNGNIYAAGKSRGIGTEYDFTVVSYDNSGEMRWESRIASLLDDEASDLFIDNQSRIYVTGYISAPQVSADFLTVKYSQEGNIFWQRQFNNPYNYWDIAQSITVDNQYNVYITGKSGRPPLQLADYTTLKYNLSGELVWSKNYNGLSEGVNEDIPRKIAVDNNNNVYVTGHSMGVHAYDVCTIKYSQQLVGINPVSSEIPNGFSLYQNYPNPFNPVTKIRFELPEGAARLVNLTVFDALGRKIETPVSQYLLPGTYEIDWNAYNYTSGIYFYKLTSKDFTEIKKMVLVK